MSSNQTILDRELFTQALRQMSEEDLRYLNHMVVEQLRHLAQAKNNHQMSQFRPGDKVNFTAKDGDIKQGTVMRLNKKTVTVWTIDHQEWKVSPLYLRKTT